MTIDTPEVDEDPLEDNGNALLTVRNLTKYFMIKSSDGVVRDKLTVKAVDDVSFDLDRGQTLGLVGESGCGKSTTARVILRLIEPTSGEIVYDGTDLAGLNKKALRRARRDMQMVFQDPYASLDPRMTVREIVGEGFRIWGEKKDFDDRVAALLDQVGLNPAFAGRYPHEFSGGQRQRIGIARALAMNPKMIILDEPVSALDVSVQAQILNLLEDMKQRYGVSLLFISHDLSVVKNISDRVMVMYMGKLCETGPSDGLYSMPTHPYTRALLAAIPGAAGAHLDDPVPEGDLPSAIDPPSGCRFRTRCPYATEECKAEEPALRAVAEDHFVACHHPRI